MITLAFPLAGVECLSVNYEVEHIECISAHHLGAKSMVYTLPCIDYSGTFSRKLGIRKVRQRHHVTIRLVTFTLRTRYRPVRLLVQTVRCCLTLLATPYIRD